MGGVVSAVVDVVQSVTAPIGDVVTDVVKTADNVIDSVVKPISTAVDNTLKAAEKDPLGTLAKVTAMVMAPELVPVVNVADAVVKEIGRAHV